MEPPGIQKRLSLNFFDPNLATKTPPKPVKPKIKKTTSILEIAQRNASTEDYRASVFDGLETKRRLTSRKKSRGSSKGVDFAVYRLDSPDLAVKVSKDTDIDLSYSDLGYLAHLYKNSVSHNHTCDPDDVDSPATSNEKFRRYVGTPGGSYSKALYDSVNYDLLNNSPRTRRKESLHSQVGDRKQSLADKPRSSSVHSNVTSHTPNLIVMKKSPARQSVSSRKGVIKEQRKDNNRKVSKGNRDLRDPLPEPPKNSVQYMATPPSPSFVIAKRKKSGPSTRSSVRFSVVEDAMELAGQLDKSKKSGRRKSSGQKKRDSYTEADYVQSSDDRDKDIEVLREQLKRTLITEPVSQTTSPDSDYVSHSSNRQSGHTSSSSSASSSSSSGDSGSSSSSDSESDSSSSSSSGSSSSSSGSTSRSSSASSSDSEKYASKKEPDSKGNKYAVKGKKTRNNYESEEEVQDGNILLGDVSHKVEKKSIICVIL